jgi:pSer/pThr/pTyr-binding forkhead associated (FHA) protein
MVMAYIQYNSTNGRKIFKLSDEKMMVFGRGDECEFQILDSQVSREHFAVKKDENENFVLIDLGSRNGTFHNEKRLENETALLNNGDRIKAVTHAFVFWDMHPIKKDQDYFNEVAEEVEEENAGFRTAMMRILSEAD